MKRITITIITLLIMLSTFSIANGAVSKNIKAKFTETNISGTDFKEIKIAPYETKSEGKNYKIYLPSGYLVEGESATYVADKNGKYPFTVYDGSYKKTFTYTVDSIDNTESDIDKGNISFNYNLMYDYEKKQVFFNMKLDKLRNVTTPNNTAVLNEVNYFIGDLKNNEAFDFNIKVDDKTYTYKVIKSGEFYLLVNISPVNYNDFSTLVEYKGYNFTNNEIYETSPPKDLYEDNGSYKVLVKSNSSQHLFSINITNIDYRRPSVNIELLEDDTLSIEAQDDFSLGYIITYDGKYVPINNKVNESFTYEHNLEVVYNGKYMFTVVDKNGNRTVSSFTVKNKRKLRPHDINIEVHDLKNSEDLFKNIGTEYRKNTGKLNYFDNILPAYMNGKSPEYFNPDSPISRAEMITIFCRLNNLPYDSNAYLKSKFIDIDNHWARDYISMGSAKKYVSGYKDKTFKPNNNVTRAEFCQMLTKITSYKSLLNDLPASNNYNFNDINSHWAEKEIIKIASRDLITSSNNNFYPDRAITRGEVVHAINKLYNLNPSYIELAHIKSLYSQYYNFKDISTHKYYYDIIISVIGMYRENLN